VGATDVEIDTGDARVISVSQVVENLQSVLTEIDSPSLSGSKEWRQDWWNTIIGYTFQGPYFWDGKGYGINLADDDGFQVGDGSLRAPHNAHLNVLARTGVPGLLLWLSIQVGFAIAMLRAGRAAARSGQRVWLGLIGWIFVYWLAALVNMTFDVYLEGPQGGILFWTLIGFGLAVASCIRESGQEALSETGQETHGRRTRPVAWAANGFVAPSGLWFVPIIAVGVGVSMAVVVILAS
jgi:hypothetical protein